MHVLGIETSCDDTGVALLDGGRVLAERTVTQEAHRRYLGVVPELASREHLDLLFPLIDEVLGDAGCDLSDLEGIAVTCGPGLAGCLILLLVSGCGLAMNNEDKLDRGEQAFAEGEYRAAIIDAKDVLLNEPDNVRGRALLGRAAVKVGDGPSAEKELRRFMRANTDFPPPPPDCPRSDHSQRQLVKDFILQAGKLGKQVQKNLLRAGLKGNKLAADDELTLGG